MKHALHFEQFCNDAPAPAWVELPPPTRSTPPAVPVAESQPCAESRGHGDVASAQDGGRAGPINGAARTHSDASQATTAGCESPNANGCALGTLEAVRVEPAPAAAPPSAPFKVGDRVMCALFISPTEYPCEIVTRSLHCWKVSFSGADGYAAGKYSASSTMLRHPTDAELAEHWPDEWIPCVSEAQWLALGDAKVDLKWHDGQVILRTWTGPDHSWGNFITHYRLARSAK